ncbi:MAG: hypothetical protein DSY35_04490 [Desulfurobacterium sp.]|nr:MAG: hypothetical protein DSY35_04490 [Desulfurobacterium sp.]
MDFEKEKLFEEKYPSFYSLLSAIAFGAEEGKTEWDVVREEVRECEKAETLLREIEAFLNDRPYEFEHVVEEVSNAYFDDTNSFLMWIEQIKRYVTSVKGRLCG